MAHSTVDFCIKHDQLVKAIQMSKIQNPPKSETLLVSSALGDAQSVFILVFNFRQCKHRQYLLVVFVTPSCMSTIRQIF